MPIVERKAPKNNLNKIDLLFSNEILKIIPEPKINIFKFMLLNQHLYFGNASKKQLNIFLQGYYSLSFAQTIKLLIKGRIKYLKEGVVITDLWTRGYFHWLLDSLPRLILVDKPEITILLPIELKNFEFIESSLRLLGFHKLYFMNQHEYKFIKKLNFPLQLGPTGNYNEEVVKEVRKRYLNGFKNNERNRNIYISRSKASRRKIANEELIIPLLLSYGIEIIHCEDLSFLEQVELFSETKLLISNHGAGLSNMLFLEGNSRVIEIRLQDDSLNNCYFSLASALDIDYYYFEAESMNSSLKDAHLNDIYLDSLKFKSFLDEFFQ